MHLAGEVGHVRGHQHGHAELVATSGYSMNGSRQREPLRLTFPGAGLRPVPQKERAAQPFLHEVAGPLPSGVTVQAKSPARAQARWPDHFSLAALRRASARSVFSQEKAVAGGFLPSPST